MSIKNLYYRLKAKITGKNCEATPLEVIRDQLREPRPLPMTVPEWEEWADRIVSGALVPADKESQKFAISEMVMHLSPTDDHKEDLYFIKLLLRAHLTKSAMP